MVAVSASSSSSQKKNLDQIKKGFSNTYLKVKNFVKNHFLKIAAVALLVGLLVGSYFVFGIEVSLISAGLVCIATIAYKILNRLKIAKFSPPPTAAVSSATALRKISTAISDTDTEIVKVAGSGRELHDSVKWLGKYRSSSETNREEMLQAIGVATLETIYKKGVERVFQITVKEITEMQKETQIVGEEVKTDLDEQMYYARAIKASPRESSASETIQKVEVIEGESLDVALTLKRENRYQEVAVLNMASFIPPASGFLSGSTSQQSSLCRRSTLFESINIANDLRKVASYNAFLRKKMVGGRYIIPEFGALFSPRVKVFRGNLDEGFAYYKQPKEVNVISSSAYAIGLYMPRPTDHRAKTKRKLQMILNTALERKQEAVVLGDYGCGACRNDPKEVAEIFKEIFQERPIYQKRMKIVFAITRYTSFDDKSGAVKSFSDALHGFEK